MTRYVDTSVLVPLFLPEETTERVQLWLQLPGNEALAISEWTVTEFASALGTYLRCREALTKGLCAPTSSETERLRLDALSASGKGIAHAVGPAALA